MKILDASRVRKSFARVLEAVRDSAEIIIVVRYGQPMAALVPMRRLRPAERKMLRRPRTVSRLANQARANKEASK